MNIDRETTQGGRKMEARDKQLRAGTAVFVGRASFRMMAGGEGPGEEIGYQVVSDATPMPVPALQSENRWFAPVELTESAERSEPVVLMPPDSVMRAAAGEAPFVAELQLERKSSARRVTPRWAIAAAVILGATATLSAQAMMRRPGRLARAAAELVGDDAQRANNKTATISIAGLAPSSALLNVATPTVVPSTATFKTDEPPQEAKAILRLVAVNRPAPSLARSAARRSVEPRLAKAVHAAPTATVWVDPFVDDVSILGGAGASHNAKRATASSMTTRGESGLSAQKTGGRRTAEVTWDDPFAQ